MPQAWRWLAFLSVTFALCLYRTTKNLKHGRVAPATTPFGSGNNRGDRGEPLPRSPGCSRLAETFAVRYPDGTRSVQQISAIVIDLTIEVDLPLSPVEGHSGHEALNDATVLVEVRCWGGAGVRNGIAPGRLRDPDTIYQRPQPTLLLIRTDGPWGGTLSVVVPLEVNASASSGASAGVATRVTIDNPTYSSCTPQWFDKAVRFLKMGEGHCFVRS